MSGAGAALGSMLSFGSWMVFGYFVLVNGIYLLLMVSAALELRRHSVEADDFQLQRLLSSPITPRISMLVPAHNEAVTIVESIRGLLTLGYPCLEIVVVDDGSTDGTLEALRSGFGLEPVHPTSHRVLPCQEITAMFRSQEHPQLVVAAKRNGGKADALNAAINLAGGDLVCSLDADTIVEEDAMQRLVRPFLGTEGVVAAGATIRVANGCVVRNGRMQEIRTPGGYVAGIQAVEYLRAFLFGRLGWNRLGGNIVISGAFALFRRQALLDIGGYRHGVGEDMDIIVRLRRDGYERQRPARVEFVADPVAWTEAPEALRVLARQRDRWHRGLSETLWHHHRVLCNPRYGVLGWVLFPFFVAIEWAAPIVEGVGLILLAVGLIIGVVGTPLALLVLLAACGLGLLHSLIAVLLAEFSDQRYGTSRDRSLMLVWAVLEHVGYRQLTVWWRLRGIARFCRGDMEWGSMERRGIPTDARSH